MRCFGLFHKWEAQGTHLIKYVDTDCHTKILYQCAKCNKVKIKEIKGHWILDSEQKKLESVQLQKAVQQILAEE